MTMSLDKFFYGFAVLLAVIFLTFVVNIHAYTTPEADFTQKSASIFPSVYFTDTINYLKKIDASRPYWVSTLEELEFISRNSEEPVSILLDNDILAFYGHPGSRYMGILGRYPIEELDKMLTELAAEYKELNGERNVRKAFYIIYGTVWPGGEIGIISNNLLKSYIEYGLENDILVFVDHQIGRYDPIDSLKRILPWLQYPNVHLALDPEWRTTKPMVEIGNITGEEINKAQEIMEEYMIEHNIPGERLLVIHQFNNIMIKNRVSVKSNFSRVRLVHCADGFGSPELKRLSYAYNAQASNIPVKGFKLFYNFGIPGAGFDKPLMTPKQVYALSPRPYLIMYQ